MFRSILVPLDGSPLAEHALPLAIAIARRSNAVLHVILVHVPDAYREYALTHVEDLDRESKGQEVAYLDRLRVRLAAVWDGRMEIHHPEGIVQETLSAETTRKQVDLVVMNAHGWGYISRALLGSVSDYLMRHLTIPLLMIHAQGDSTAIDRPVSMRRVLVPLDGSKLAEAVLGPATALGDLWQAEYRLLRVVAVARAPSAAELEHPFPLPRSVRDEHILAAEDFLANVAARLRTEARTVETCVAVNPNVTAAVLHSAATTDCDLIAISTHGRGGLSRLLMGSVADKVVRGAQLPVLVYRAAESD